MFDTRQIVDRLNVLESLAVIPRVSSTNLIGRRVVNECIENDRALPRAMIIAAEQYAGMGRNQRVWSSPRGKGIYATTLLTRDIAGLPLVPLEMANVVCSFLTDVFAVDAKIKWPNDILAGGKKIAGILIEARIQDDRAFLLAGTGINVEPVHDASRPNSISMAELSPRGYRDLESATIAFIEHVDERLLQCPDREAVLEEWRRRAVHAVGDKVTSVVGDRTISGTWSGIDDQGRALIRRGAEVTPVSAGDLIVRPEVSEA